MSFLNSHKTYKNIICSSFKTLAFGTQVMLNMRIIDLVHAMPQQCMFAL
jgi:hypothetical protein